MFRHFVVDVLAGQKRWLQFRSIPGDSLFGYHGLQTQCIGLAQAKNYFFSTPHSQQNDKVQVRHIWLHQFPRFAI